MSEAVKLNLRQKLCAIYTKLDHVEKMGRNSKQNYSFVRAADMLRAMRNAFAELGVYAETNYELLGTYDIKTNSGGTMHTATVRATIKLHDCDSDETMTISGLGDGADSGDKGIYKAQTGSTKNALRNGSLMPDEADPEADESVDRQVSDMPEFHDDPRPPAAPKPTKKPEPVELPREDERPTPPPVQQSAPEQGDAYEGPDDDRLPTEEELNAYRAAFSKLGDDLTTTGKLKPSKGLAVNVKLKAFLLQITGAAEPKAITSVQWKNFFSRAEAVKAKENGMVGLTKLVNKANGIEDTK